MQTAQHLARTASPNRPVDTRFGLLFIDPGRYGHHDSIVEENISENLADHQAQIHQGNEHANSVGVVANCNTGGQVTNDRPHT